jgi:hypothetical protein
VAKIFEEQTYVIDVYNAVVGKTINASNACKTLWYNSQCFDYGKVCNSSTGESMRLCLATCVALWTTCSLNATQSNIESGCAAASPPPGAQCFGSYGVFGMLPPPTTPAPTTTLAPTTTTPEPSFPTTSAICSNQYTGLTTCAVLNAYPTRDSDMEYILRHQFYIPDSFNTAPATFMNKSDTCRALYYDLTCFQYATMCTSTGEPLKLCVQSCVRFYQACRFMDAATIFSTCNDVSAPQGTQCFRSTGILNCGPNSNSTTGSTPISSLADCRCNADYYGTDDMCVPCPEYSNSVAGTTAVSGCLCIPGYTWDAGRCVACPAGSYKETRGSAGCVACAGNKYSVALAASAASACVACPLQSTSPAGSASPSACVCRAGFGMFL